MTYTTLHLLKDLWSYIRPYKKNFLWGTWVRFSSDVVWLFPPWALSEIITFATTYQTGDSLDYFWFLMGGVWVCGLYHYFGHDYAKYLIYFVAERARIDLFQKAIKHLFFLDNDWHEQENSGNKIQRVNKAGEGTDQIIRLYVDMFIESSVNIVGISALLFALGPTTSVMMLIFFITYFWMAKVLTRRAAYESYRTNIEWENFDGVVFEAVNNIATIKALGAWRSIMNWLEGVSSRLRTRIKTRIFFYRMRAGAINYYREIFRQIMIFYVVWQVFQGNLEIGVIAMILLYFQKISESAEEFAEISYRYEIGRIDMMRLKEILNAKPTAEVSGTQAFPKNWKKLEVRGLRFSYEGREVLKDVNFTVKRGEKIGIVGISGAGKSTLFKLLLKLYDRYEGEIRFDNRELKDIKRESYLKHFSYVPQETELFDLSLKQNVSLAIGKRESKKAFEEAISIAHVKDFIHKLPEGVDSLIGEKGVKLSGGEKQRVGIARAVYRQPELLLLDEATSHLDAESEKKIQEALHEFFQDVTAIVIAHRLSTLQEMDRILVIEKGQVVEEGSFEQLVKKRGSFYKLWKKQKF